MPNTLFIKPLWITSYQNWFIRRGGEGTGEGRREGGEEGKGGGEGRRGREEGKGGWDGRRGREDSAHDNSRTSDVFRSILLSVRSILRMRGKNVRTAFYVTGNSGKAPVQTVKFSVKKWALGSEKILPMDAIVREKRP